MISTGTSTPSSVDMADEDQSLQTDISSEVELLSRSEVN